MIDCGKTARETCMRFMPSLGVRAIDAVVLTHGHADAILGLDDLRDIQDTTKRAVTKDGTKSDDYLPTPVFLDEHTMKDCARCFPYLIPPPNPVTHTADPNHVKRRVSKIDWQVFTYMKPFYPIEGVEFTPIPLLHGGDYICAGYVIRGGFEDDSIVAYLSDVNEIPEETMSFLTELPHIDLLIIDSLLRDVKHNTHFSLEEAKDVARVLRPRQTRCVGMTCEMGLHEDVDAELATLLDVEGLDIRLGYDGFRFPL